MIFFKRKEKIFMENVVDNADVVLFYLDLNGNIAVCNKKVAEISGKKKEEIIGKSCFDVFCRDNSATAKHKMFKAVIDDSVQYNRPNQFEGMIADKDNTQRLISWSITPILSRSNKPQGVLLIGNDATQIAERNASLKNIDETLKNIFSSIKEYALYVVNLDGNITYYGMGSEIMFGWQKNEIIFKHYSLLHSKENASKKLPFLLQQAREKGLYETELELVKKNGDVFPVILTVNKFMDKEGQLSGYVFMAKDITERRKLEHEIIQSEKLAAIGKLSAGIAHEINNPLFVISGRLELMLEEEGLNDSIKENLRTMCAQADRIRKLVDQLLKYSRKAQPRFEPVNINEVVEEIFPLLSYHKLPDVKVQIQKELAKEVILVKADINQLQEVLINLLVNAYQAMNKEGIIKIKTSIAQNNYAQITISDNGCGISTENLKSIFMPFFSTKKDGTGLGLSICYNIIKNHHGSLDLESQLGQGTTFIIKIPLA
jgi:PAS domain S-box-containing protein